MAIKAINDKPNVMDASDLSPINEGDEGKWNLRDRFFDVITCQRNWLLKLAKYWIMVQEVIA